MPLFRFCIHLEYVTVSVPHSSESIMLEGRVGENVSFVCEYPCNCSCLDQEIGAGASCVMHWCVQSTANGLKHCSDDPSPPGAEYKFLDGIAENYPPTKDCDEGNSTRQTSLLEFTAQELHDGLVFSCRVSPHESNAYAYSNPLLLSVTGMVPYMPHVLHAITHAHMYTHVHTNTHRKARKCRP